MERNRSKKDKSSSQASAHHIGRKSLSVAGRSVMPGELTRSETEGSVFRQENEGESTGPLNVTYPSSAEGDIQHSSQISNAYSVPWRAFIENDRLTFGFDYPLSAEATIRVVLRDDQGNGYLGEGSVHWGPNSGGGEQFIQFSGFPPRADGSIMDSCETEAIMTNNESASSGIHGYEKIFRG